MIDGRPEVTGDIAGAEDEVRNYILECITELLRSGEFVNALPGHVERGRDAVVLDRLRSITLVDHYDRHLKGKNWGANQSDWRSKSPALVNCVAAMLNLGHHALDWDLSSNSFNELFASQIARLPGYFQDVSNEVEGRDARPGDIYWWESTQPDEETASHVGICVGPGDTMVHAQPWPGGKVVMCHCEEHGADIYFPTPDRVYRWIGPLQRGY